MNLNDARTDLARALAGTDLRVATDPAKAHAPCVLVGPVTEVEKAGGCAYDAVVPVWLIAPAPGDEAAVAWLAEHITDVLDVLAPLAEVESTTLGAYDVGQGSLPAYESTTRLTVKQ